MQDSKTLILNNIEASQKIKRIAYQIVEKYFLEKKNYVYWHFL